MQKIKVGLIEPIKVKGKKTVKILGKFDTGARRTSIDKKLVSHIGVDHVGSTSTSNVHGTTVRPLVNVLLEIKGKRIKVRANVADRSSRKYKILLGRDVIFNNFVIDISKTHKSPELRDLK
jgi:hypothetical protein